MPVTVIRDNSQPSVGCRVEFTYKVCVAARTPAAEARRHERSDLSKASGTARALSGVRAVPDGLRRVWFSPLSFAEKEESCRRIFKHNSGPIPMQ